MKTAWSNTWKASQQPRKQRKYRHEASLHTKQKFVAAHLSKDLRKKHGRRSANTRKGDIVKVLRGQFKGRTAKITAVNLKRMVVFVEGIENIRKDGTKKPYPMQPSNLMITELNMNDKKRQQKLGEKKEK